MEYRIVCKKLKPDKEGFEIIDGLRVIDPSGLSMYFNEEELIEKIREGDKFFVLSGKEKVYIHRNKTEKGYQYVQTYRDGTTVDNLENLILCSWAEEEPKTTKDILREKPWLPLLPLLVGLLLPFLFCYLFPGCSTICRTKTDTLRIHDTVYVKVPMPYPPNDKLIKTFEVHFVTNKYTLTDFETYTNEHGEDIMGNVQLEESLKELKKNPFSYVNIVGFADERGSYKYNFVLSKNRVNTVYQYFLANKIDSTRILLQDANGKNYSKSHLAEVIAAHKDHKTLDKEELKYRRVDIQLLEIKPTENNKK